MMFKSYLIFAYVALFIAFTASQISLEVAKTTPNSLILGKKDNSSSSKSKLCKMKKPGRKMYQCCKSMPKMFIEKNKDACASNCTFPNLICCLFDCTLKKAGVLNADGAINGTLYISRLKQAFNGTKKWNPIIENVVTNCVSTASDLVANWGSVMVNHTCKDAPERMPIDHCIWRNLFLNCPKKVDGNDCKKLYEYAEASPAYPKDQYCARKGKKNANY